MHTSQNFRNEINAFEQKLESVVIDEVSVKQYCRNYLLHLLQHKRYYLEIYADVLNRLITHSSEQKSKIQLVDYGAGNGLLGLFAKFCGFGKVWINDMDADFVDASQRLSKQLEISIDGFITGDISQVKNQVKENIAAVIGTDVIEHIYDLPTFIKTMREINPSLVSIFTTASNPENFLKVRALKKLQVKDELEGGDPTDHLLFGADPLQPYLHMRSQIIRESCTGLTENEIGLLAKATRGLMKSDIISAVSLYRQNGKLPTPASGVNTCNPLTGSWTERLLPLDTYRIFFTDAGYTTEFYPGFYNEFGKGPAHFAKKMLNKAISIIGTKISPFIVIVSFKK